MDSMHLFLLASLTLAFTPGAGMLYVLSRTIEGGKIAGIYSTLGAAAGGMFHVLAAALGVSILLELYPIAFSIIKYLGSLFLFYLGFTMIIKSKNEENLKALSKIESINTAFYQGVISEILNPKTAIFFLAFVPQFIDSSNKNVFMQFLLLGTIVVIINTIPDFIISFSSEKLSKTWNQNKKNRFCQKVISGVILITLGIYLALSP